MNPEVDEFLKKSKFWREEMTKLRSIILRTKLREEIKWGKPCYTHEGRNIAIMQPFKNCLGMMFFKGALLKDPEGILLDNGPNSQSAKRFEFDSVQSITKLTSTIKAYLKEAMALEEAGAKVEFKKKPEALPEELLTAFKKRPKLRKAFEALTPGRQRGYILHISGAKQVTTRESRIEKCIPRIMSGKGLNDR